ncbi:MAG: hypothetical protein ACKVIN_14025 [Longimicrobiales bacterium]
MIRLLLHACPKRFRDRFGAALRAALHSGATAIVVGVAGDVTHNGLTTEVNPKFYISGVQWELVTQGNSTPMRLVVPAVTGLGLTYVLSSYLGALLCSVSVAGYS